MVPRCSTFADSELTPPVVSASPRARPLHDHPTHIKSHLSCVNLRCTIGKYSQAQAQQQKSQTRKHQHTNHTDTAPIIVGFLVVFVVVLAVAVAQSVRCQSQKCLFLDGVFSVLRSLVEEEMPDGDRVSASIGAVKRNYKGSTTTGSHMLTENVCRACFGTALPQGDCDRLPVTDDC